MTPGLALWAQSALNALARLEPSALTTGPETDPKIEVRSPVLNIVGLLGT